MEQTLLKLISSVSGVYYTVSFQESLGRKNSFLFFFLKIYPQLIHSDIEIFQCSASLSFWPRSPSVMRWTQKNTNRNRCKAIAGKGNIVVEFMQNTVKEKQNYFRENLIFKASEY